MTPYPETLGQRRGAPGNAEIFTDRGWERPADWWGMLGVHKEPSGKVVIRVSATVQDTSSTDWRAVWCERMAEASKAHGGAMVSLYSAIERRAIMGFVPS